jgi:peptide/nickel transport system permease protein
MMAFLRGRQHRRRTRRAGLGVAGWCCAAWVVLISLGALLAPWLPLDDPKITDFAVANNAPPFTSGHLLGPDQNGLDIFSRIVWGGRVSLVVALGVLVLGMTIGGAIGLVAGFARGKVEAAAPT